MTDMLERAGMLLDVVQKVASVAPAYTALSSVAMAELKEMNTEAQRQLDELGQRRLREEQETAAALNEHNRRAAERQAEVDAEIAARTAASNAAKPITVMPGEPVPDVVRQQAGEIDSDPTPHELDVHDPEPHVVDDRFDMPVTRRV